MNRTINCIFFLITVSSFSFAQDNKSENLTCSQAFAVIQKFQNDTNFVILDLRTQVMYDEEHIENAIVYDVFSVGFDTWVSKLKKDKKYLLYCTRGHRSGIAIEKMKQMGFINLYHLYQGITEWKNQGFKTIKKIATNT
jgi:rhodanese-related sulfurtransferase